MSDIRAVLIVLLTGALMLAASAPAALAFVWLAEYAALAMGIGVAWLVGFSMGWFWLYDWLNRNLP